MHSLSHQNKKTVVTLTRGYFVKWCWAHGNYHTKKQLKLMPLSFSLEWLANKKRPEDLKQITLTDISIDMMTEAFATVDMSVASNMRVNLWCKVDTGAWGNVMPLWAFAKLFPNQLMKTGMPIELWKCNTKLRAYNGTNIPQLSTLDIAITWKDEDTKKVHKMGTTFYVVNIPGPAILGF